MAFMGQKISGKGLLRTGLKVGGEALGNYFAGPVGGVIGKDIGTAVSNEVTNDEAPTKSGDFMNMFKDSKDAKEIPKGDIGSFMGGKVFHDGSGGFSIDGLDFSSLKNLFGMGAQESAGISSI